MSEAQRVRDLCAATLRQNWREGERDGVSYGYTCPSPGRYPWQWYWDSCFAAIAGRRIDRARARTELETLLSGGLEDGFVGHTHFWGEPVSWERLPFYNVTGRRARSTSTIQPPLLAWAWSLAVGDPAGEPRIAAHHSWLTANRDLDGDGLLWIVQPDESGLDASPKFDSVWGRTSVGRAGFPLLVARNRRLGWDARRIEARGHPVLCEVVTNVLWGLSRLAMGHSSTTPALIERCWDEEAGVFTDDVRPAGRRSRTLTWSALAPLALPDLPEAIGRRLVEEHLLDEQRFWAPVPVPSVSLDDPAFTTTDRRGPVRIYWRGPSWINATWLVWSGMKRLGYLSEAAELARRVVGTMAREGLREYYGPLDGRGMGARDFTWSALAWELAEDVAPA